MLAINSCVMTNSSEFLHTNPNHARLPCRLCHKREDNSPRLRLPGHLPCSGCHVPEFQSAQAPLCSICHEGTNGGNADKGVTEEQAKALVGYMKSLRK